MITHIVRSLVAGIPCCTAHGSWQDAAAARQRRLGAGQQGVMILVVEQIVIRLYRCTVTAWREAGCPLGPDRRPGRLR